MGATLRTCVLLAGLASAAVAWHYWTSGAPPLWSFVARRTETVVTAARLVEEPRPDSGANGGTHTVAHVAVAWPPGAATSAELPGLRSPHQRWHLHVPREIVRDHPVGAPIAVRVVGGRPVADRTDIYEMAYAVFWTMFAVGLTAAGLVLTIGRLRRRDSEEENAA